MLAKNDIFQDWNKNEYSKLKGGFFAPPFLTISVHNSVEEYSLKTVPDDCVKRFDYRVKRL